MTLLERLVAESHESLAAHAAAEPGAGRFESLDASDDRRLALEAVHEGDLLHHGAGRAFSVADPDLAILGGDSLFALALERLATAGDLEAVAELADAIALVARARAEGRTDLVDQLWEGAGMAHSRAGGGGAGAAWRDRAPESRPRGD